MRVLKIDSPFKDYQAYRFESGDLRFTAYEKDYGRRFVVEDTFDKVAPFHRIIVDCRKNEENKVDPDVKWDTILEEDLKIDSIEVRPKKGNLYQRLEPAYEGVHLYFRLLKEPENESLRKEVETLRISQSLHHSLERYTFDQKEYHAASSTHESSQRTLVKLTETHDNFADKLKKEKSEIIPDSEKIDYYVERLYFYKTKLKRTKRRIERAEKRYHRAKEDVSLAKERADYLQSLMREGFKAVSQPAPVDNIPILKTIVKVEEKPIEKKEKKEVKAAPEPVRGNNQPPRKEKRRCHVYYLMVIAILLGVIGWLLMKNSPMCVQNEKACPVVEKVVEIEVEKIVEVEKECPEMEETALTPPSEMAPEPLMSEEIENSAREAYRRGVLNYQTQAPFDFALVLDNFAERYLNGDKGRAQDIEASIENFNELWNDFRRSSYDEHYTADRILKSEVVQDEALQARYMEDEKLLYHYSKRYKEMFVKIAAQFLQMECSNGCVYEKQIRSEMKEFGHPEYKLFLMQQMRKVMEK
ncbi:MAG: hypothetical protein JW812_01855 [Alphaproteobacteria bacterium]|nr:hypothetical protein [Alphaproteobacteria bacterium]MBN2780159.1 hypothetical protein [Alphaproteobacteria bacterium]